MKYEFKHTSQTTKPIKNKRSSAMSHTQGCWGCLQNKWEDLCSHLPDFILEKTYLFLRKLMHRINQETLAFAFSI